jgi:ABC-type transporter Mla subunit MlaD
MSTDSETDSPSEDGSAKSRDPLSDLLGLFGSLASLSTIAAPIAQAVRQVNLEQLAGWRTDAENLLGTLARLHDSLNELQRTADAVNEQLGQILQNLSKEQGSDSR